MRITAITGVVKGLPLEAGRNTAGVAVAALVETVGLEHGFELTIEKGIPLGSGLGGSAASSVAAVVAVNALLATPLDKLALLKCAMKGEQVASGALHVDNVAPSLYGGLVLTVGIDDPNVKQIPVPDEVRCVLVHPHIELPTRKSRQVLKTRVALSDVIWQQANLAGFLTGCFTGRFESDSRLPRGRRHRASTAVADPGIPVRQGGGARARRARLFDLRRGSNRVRLVRARPRDRDQRRDGGGVRVARPGGRSLGLADQLAGCAGRTA